MSVVREAGPVNEVPIDLVVSRFPVGEDPSIVSSPESKVIKFLNNSRIFRARNCHWQLDRIVSEDVMNCLEIFLHYRAAHQVRI